MNNEDLYEVFLDTISDLFKIEVGVNINNSISDEMKIFLLSCFTQHKDAIIGVMNSGYRIIKCYFKENLSGDYAFIKLNELDKFKKSIDLERSDLAPVVVFSLPNKLEHEKMSDMRILRIEFMKPGMAPLI